MENLERIRKPKKIIMDQYKSSYIYVVILFIIHMRVLIEEETNIIFGFFHLVVCD